MKMIRSLIHRTVAGLSGNLHTFLDPSFRDTFQDDARLFDARQLMQRAGWRRKLHSSGEAARLEALREIHSGERCFIIGNGPSLKQQDLTRLAGEITFVTNWFANHEQYDEIRPTYYCISSHEVFGGWKTTEPELDRTLRQRITGRTWRSHHFFPLFAQDSLRRDPAFAHDKTNYLIFERPKASVIDRGALNWDVCANMDDGLTGIVTFCIPLAVHMGIREIYLLGCDCDYQIQNVRDPKAYFYDFKQHTTRTSAFGTLTKVWGEGGSIFEVYDIVRREAAARGVEIFNSTEGGLLETFERHPLDEVLG
jgi:hypothetical protein